MGAVTRLTAYLARWRDRPFQPGVSDCAIFAAGWVRASGGPDLSEGWAGTYGDLAEGLDLLAEAGFGGVDDLAAAHLTEIPSWTRAQIGDVAFVREGNHLCAGIVGGAEIHVLRIDGGLDVVPLERAVRVFRP